MAIHNEIGRRGEEIAIRYLQELNYHILEHNWRFSKAEIDIIAMDGGALVFVEVKTKQIESRSTPIMAVSPKKTTMIIDAATRYMEEIDHDWEVRFDVIEVIYLDEDHYKVSHHIDSYSPWDE